MEPGAVQGHSRELSEHYETEKKLNLDRDSRPPVEISAAAVNGAGSTLAAGPAFLLRQIVIDESAILSPEEIRSVLARYEQKQATIADLNLAVQELNSLYRQKGYATAMAVLPPQQVRDGMVRLRLIEGRVGKIVIAKTRAPGNPIF